MPVKLIDRYFGALLLRGYLLVGGSFLVLFGMLEFMDRAGEIGVFDFDAADALLVTGMVMPARLVDLLPFIAMLGVVYALAGMARANEIVAMRNAGMSSGRIYRMCASGTLALLSLAIAADFVVRPLSQQGELMFMSATSKDGSLFSDSGVWTEMRGGILHIQSLSFVVGHRGLSWYEFYPSGALHRAVFAERAMPREDGSMDLENVVEKQFADVWSQTGSGQDGLSSGGATAHQAHRVWQPPMAGQRVGYPLPVEQLSLPDLYGQVRQLRAQGKPGGTPAMAFWQRLLLPLTAVVFTLFGAGLVLRVGPRAGMGAVVSLGVGIAFALFLLQQFATNALFLIWPAPLVVVLLPNLVLLALAVWLNRELAVRRAS